MSETLMVTIKISKGTKVRLNELCEQNGLKMRWVVEQAIIQYCDRHESNDMNSKGK